LQGRVTRELQELGVSGNIINQVNAIASSVAIAQAKLEAENAAAAGEGFAAGFEGLGGIIEGIAPFFGGSQSTLARNFTGSPDAANQLQNLAFAASVA